jgi:hypothetical protein
VSRAVVLLLATVLAAAFAAGCGGSKVDAEEVEAPPTTLTLPRGGDTLASEDSSSGSSSSSADEDEDDEDADATATATPGSAATAAPTATATAAPGGGTGGAGTGTDDSGTGQSGGANFDEFCQQNPGACPNP